MRGQHSICRLGLEAIFERLQPCQQTLSALPSNPDQYAVLWREHQAAAKSTAQQHQNAELKDAEAQDNALHYSLCRAVDYSEARVHLVAQN